MRGAGAEIRRVNLQFSHGSDFMMLRVKVCKVGISRFLVENYQIHMSINIFFILFQSSIEYLYPKGLMDHIK